jgi:cell division protein FtsN
MKQQRGGTLLGLIIGVVIGLAVALIVALYVTKTPVPFMNKGQNRTPEQDVAEEKKNKDWDPNAPLQNKAKPAASAAPVTRPDVPAPAVKQGKSESKSEKSEGKSSTDPLGDLARAKAGGTEPFIWFVQVGAFRNPDDAETQRAKLSLTGVEARVTEKEISGRQVYRVRVGPFDRKDEAEKVETRLKAAGNETKVLREQR